MERLANATDSAGAAVQDIRAMIARREGAMRGRDAATIAADYAPDALKFDLAPPLQNVGVDAAALQAWLDGFDGEIDFAVTDLAISVSTDASLAFCHSLNRLSTTPHGADFRFTLWYRATLCLRQTPTGWQIAHEHNSTPFYMDGTLRAATDLTP